MKIMFKNILIAAGFLAFGGVLALGVHHVSSQREAGVAEFVRIFDTADDAMRERIAETYLARYPATVLLDALEEKYAGTVCHTVGHPIGRAIYKRAQNFSASLQACGSKCTYGCFHGVLMQMFSTNSDTLGGVITEESPDAYIAHVKSVAQKLCDAPEVTSVVRSRFCYHGLGHVFAYVTNENVHKAIALCAAIPQGSPRESCVSGAFMEYLFSASSSAELNTTDEKPCDAFPDIRDDCYRYKARGWIHEWGDARRAMTHCDAFGKNANLCIREIAYNASYAARIADESGLDKLCGALTGTNRDNCIDGALLKIIVLNDGNDTPALCNGIAAAYQARCVHDFDAYHGIAQ